MIQYNQLLNQNQPTFLQQNLQKIHFSLSTLIFPSKWQNSIQVSYQLQFQFNNQFLIDLSSQYVILFQLFLKHHYQLVMMLKIFQFYFHFLLTQPFLTVQYPKSDYFNCYYMKGINQYNFKFQPFQKQKYCLAISLLLKYCQQLAYIGIFLNQSVSNTLVIYYFINSTKNQNKKEWKESI
ncbi:unnamed protein product (macronuclear) [Paramecium tetraurelia]|uniref:Transmembrane protein n=1 Tax=Paramecium tetraurelia TaxID=5888 RepID=A0C3Q8_PARTE|nr:uncharacterized protein GSPATT00034904001 [Paramecium tetraurelia]CAK65425.1 unnamed protein product [Paramecium tetraurelia]|eukprot:XP_001432822.1 hypothetical protein (macronuclear) [Paramecium tetraurelia strain d4-2]